MSVSALRPQHLDFPCLGEDGTERTSGVGVQPPFRWDRERRVTLGAKLGALYFHLYGITDREDIRYVYSTFPMVKRVEKAAYGTVRLTWASRGRTRSLLAIQTRTWTCDRSSDA